MQIFLEIFPGLHLGQDAAHNHLVVVEDVVERERLEVIARLEVDVFAEGESVEHVAAAQRL